MIAQQLTITVQDGQQWAFLDALAAALGPGEFLGLALRRVAVPNGARHETSWQTEASGAGSAPLPPQDPAVMFEYVRSRVNGLDTRVRCAVCGAQRSVRMASAVYAWPRCCGVPMEVLRTSAEIRWPDGSVSTVPSSVADGGPVGADSDAATKVRGGQPDGEALRDLFSQHGFVLESGRLNGTLRAIRGAFRGGMSLGDLGAGLSKARAQHGGGKKGSVPAIWCDTSTKHYGGRTYTYLRLRWPDGSKKCGRGCRTIYKF